MPKQIKQVATTEDYIVARYEDDSIGVYNRYGNTKGALREIAEVQGFEYDPTWTTRQFGKKLIDAVDNGAPAIANDHYIVYIDTNGTIICGERFEGDTKEGLRSIARKYNISYEKGWNTHQFGRKVIECLLSVRVDIEEFLMKNTKLFYNERDLQMNLALFLKSKGYYDEVFLEYSLSLSLLPKEIEELKKNERKGLFFRKNKKGKEIMDSNIRIDIVLLKGGIFYPIEIKYKTKKEKKNSNFIRFGVKMGELKHFKDQGAQNIGRYSFWKDVARIEFVKECFSPNIAKGFCVFVTNDESYKADHTNFSMKEKKEQDGVIQWDKEELSLATTHPKILLKQRYRIENWIPLENEFFGCIVEV